MTTLQALPDEILLHIASYLEPSEAVSLQLVSQQFRRLCRDNILWKQLCFEHSVAERRRRRRDITMDVDRRLADIARAAHNIGRALLLQARPQSSDGHAQRSEPRKKGTLLADWDPTYPGEKVNFYQDYVQRHAPHSISWFQNSPHGHEDDHLHHEATGAGILFDNNGLADKLIAPLDDGSVTIWEASRHSRQGRIIAKSPIGLLANRGPDLDSGTRLQQSQAIMTDTGAVECVSIDSRQNKAFFAVRNILNEVDLNTLDVVSRTPFPFAITALSEALHPTPLTVGTNWTVHLHDTRKPPRSLPVVRTELIGGSAHGLDLQTGDIGDHVSLSEPGALSILHLPTGREWGGNGDIWVGGRFTSFLNFDRRFFPRLRGTVHSGARISCLSSIPHPFIPHDLRLGHPYSSPKLLYEAKSIPGHTIIAAGEYKGKGSLELYSLSSDKSRSTSSTDHSTSRNQHTRYQNRQTASSTKLLSVAPHGTRLVFSDGGGNLKWVERDGSTQVREFNLRNECFVIPGGIESDVNVNVDDYAQKILPTVSSAANAESDVPLGQDNLVVWTSNGKLGLVGFGGAGFDLDEASDLARTEEEESLRKREREYGTEMRRALEHQARELRWLRGYGL